MEPLVSDPVAMEIDENGKFYVVEMHGYPLDTEGSGLIRKLYDDNGDGSMDRSEIFYDQLVLPTGIMKWQGGLLVTDPPHLLYLEDTDDDGKADRREVMLTGFALSNPQHNFNTPIYGLDNWIYLANEGTYSSSEFEHLFGDEGSEIYFPDDPTGPRLSKNAEDRNVRVDLLNRRLEVLSGDSQFGHTFDKWGHHFSTTNWSHIYHEVIKAQYIARNKHLLVASTTQYVPDYGIGFELFPITKNPQHQLLTDVGSITSSCGITWYQGGLFPEPYQDVVFIAEPTHNLIHSDIMYQAGATFGSKRQFEDQQFLASTDGWFRPVNFYIGPDGALYLLDYYRKIIEHPEWLSEEVLNSGDLYQGTDKGRIFRITPKESTVKIPEIKLGQATADQLVQHLQNPNIWWRRHAQRMLVDRQDSDAVNKLIDFSENTNDLGLLHALWTLEGLNHFDKNLVLAALDHPVAGVRENGIQIAELHRLDFPELEDKLISMVSDPDPKVRFQLLCTLGYYESAVSQKAIKDLLFKDIDDPWVQLAALSASIVDPLQLIEQASQDFGNTAGDGSRSLFLNLGRTMGLQGTSNTLNRLIQTITSTNDDATVWWRSAVLEGLAETITQEQEIDLNNELMLSLARYFRDDVNHSLRSSSLKLLNALGYFNGSNGLVLKAKNVVADTDQSLPFRMDAVKILAWSDADLHRTVFQSLLSQAEPEELRESAIQALEHTVGTEVCDYLINAWATMTPSDRNRAIDIFFSSVPRQLLLLEAVNDSKIQSSTIGWRRTVALLNSQHEEVRRNARATLEGNETISDSVWLQYQSSLALVGNSENGSKVFDFSCAPCHQIGGDGGTEYGPDLAAIRNRSKSGILIDILKPNRSISDGYELWAIRDKQGDTFMGIISEESANSISLLLANGEVALIQKSTIESKSAAEISGMPEGLHGQISQQQMADLLEFLKTGRSL